MYGTAESCPQGVTIYLVPGLTSRQRRAVIRRLRQEASRACGPELPLPPLLVALGLDRVRVAVKLTTGAVRLHPAVTLLPTGLVATAMLLLVLTSAGVRSVPAVAGAALGTSQAASAAIVGNSDGHGTAGFDSVVRNSAAIGNSAGGAGADSHSDGADLGSVGSGGQGLGSGQPARPTGRSVPRTARVCFGAMPGVAAKQGKLACRRTRS